MVGSNSSEEAIRDFLLWAHEEDHQIPRRREEDDDTEERYLEQPEPYPYSETDSTRPLSGFSRFPQTKF